MMMYGFFVVFFVLGYGCEKVISILGKSENCVWLLVCLLVFLVFLSFFFFLVSFCLKGNLKGEE